MLHHIDSEAHGPLGGHMINAVQSCVHCGFCLAACPTYSELGQEMDSPRGRIILMKDVLEGSLELEQTLPHIDQCLGCLSCEPACPSGVPYRDLISPFRALANDQRKRSLLERIRRTLVAKTLPYPARFRFGAKMAKIGKAFEALVPESFRPMLDLLPDQLPSKQSWPVINPAKGTPQGRVALLIGCAQQVLEPDINTATIEVLNHNGIEVVIPPLQGCCGALSWHIGDLPAAQKFAAENIKAFQVQQFDAIITNAAGCGSGLHEYHLIMAGTPLENEAEVFRNQVMDITTYLGKLSQQGKLSEFRDCGREQVIAYHDACHLANAQGITRQPRDLLNLIPGVKIAEISDSHICCGSAGTYNIDQPEIAASLGEKKVKNIMATEPDLIATGNIGCMSQVKAHLNKQGSNLVIKHTIQILRDHLIEQ